MFEKALKCRWRWSNQSRAASCCSFCPHQGRTVKNLQLSSYQASLALILMWVFGSAVGKVCLLSITEGRTRLFGAQLVVSGESLQQPAPLLEAADKVSSSSLQHSALWSLWESFFKKTIHIRKTFQVWNNLSGIVSKLTTATRMIMKRTKMPWMYVRD